MSHILLLVTHKYDNELDIIGVKESPPAAEANRNPVTPMLLKAIPPPVLRVAGELANEQHILVKMHIVSPRGFNATAGQGQARPTAPVPTRNPRGA